MDQTTTLESKTRKPVVLLRQDRGRHLHSSRWARQLAERLDTDLVVVRLMRPARRTGNRSTVARSDAVKRVMHAQTRWRRRFSREPMPALVSLPAELSTQELGSALAELNPQLVVMDSNRVWPQNSAGWLSLECGAPCLVARPMAGRGVMAATSLEDRQLPVMSEAQRVARALKRPLTLLHNRQTSVIEAALLKTDEKLLWGAAEKWGADAVVTSTNDAADSILELATMNDADLIVVGASVSMSRGAHGVSPRVCASARRSVLIVPVSSNPRRLS